MAALTINEALGWLKTLKERHAELVTLRNGNAREMRRFLGMNAEKTIEEKPTYDVKALDKLVTQVAREIRIVEMAIKRTNAETKIAGYDQKDEVLGELS